MSLFARLFREESGQDLIEYVLVIALVSVTLVAALGGLKDDIGALFGQISNAFNL